MDTYEFEIRLTVRVEAFDKADALDILHDNFDPGSDCGVEIVKLDIKE